MGRFQDTPLQIPDSKIPSVQIPGYSWANSRFRVSEFPRPPLGSKPKGADLRSTIPKFQIPSFRVSEVPSSVQGRGTPESPQIPDSEFPSFRGPLLALGSQQEGLAKFPDSEFPSVIPRAYVRREQIPEYTAQFLFPLLYSCVASASAECHICDASMCDLQLFHVCDPATPPFRICDLFSIYSLNLSRRAVCVSVWLSLWGVTARSILYGICNSQRRA